MTDNRADERRAVGSQLTSAILLDVVILACAISAGIHAALAPSHFAEGVGAGSGFVAATVLLALVAIALTRRPQATGAPVAAGIVFAALLASYALATTVGLPGLHPEPEPADTLGVATKAVEAVGLAAVAAALLARPGSRPARSHLPVKGT